MYFDENEVEKKELNISKMTLSHFLTCFENNRIVCAKKGKKVSRIIQMFMYKIQTHSFHPIIPMKTTKNCAKRARQRQSMTAHILCCGLPVLLTFGGHCAEP